MLKKITMTIALAVFIFAMPSVPVMGHGEEVHCEETALSSIMKDMNDDLKSYVKAFKRNDKMAMQVQLLNLLANTKKSKEEVPLKLKQGQQTVQQREAKYREYQQGLDKLTELLQQLQTASSKTEVKT